MEKFDLESVKNADIREAAKKLADLIFSIEHVTKVEILDVQVLDNDEFSVNMYIESEETRNCIAAVTPEKEWFEDGWDEDGNLCGHYGNSYYVDEIEYEGLLDFDEIITDDIDDKLSKNRYHVGEWAINYDGDFDIDDCDHEDGEVDYDEDGSTVEVTAWCIGTQKFVLSRK